MRSIWDETRPPCRQGTRRWQEELIKKACDRIPARGMFATLDIRVVRVWYGTTDHGPTYAVHLQCTTADRITGISTGIAMPIEFPASVAEHPEYLDNVLRAGLREMIEHELQESLWDGRPETDPHRFDEADR